MIRTARLVLRPPGERDVPAIVAGCSDPEVPRFIPVIPVPFTERDARGWLAGDAERLRTDAEYTFAITRREEDRLLGVISVRLRPGGSVGYWLSATERGTGVMTEALAAVTAWARDEHGIRSLHLTTHPDNLASQRVAEKAGFTRVGVVAHEPRFRDGSTRAVRFELR